MEETTKAIKLAVGAGYKYHVTTREHKQHWFGLDTAETICIPQTLLDPLFWQALGKALGWDKTVCVHCGAIVTYGEDTLSEIIHCNHKEIKDIERKWLNVWHCFIDHLAEGKDAESFFTNLTS